MERRPDVAGELLQRYRLTSDQVSKEDVRLLLRELEDTLQRGTPGDVVEFGCYIGTTSLFIRRLLDACHSDKTFHVYDSFSGLPVKERQDASAAGEGFKTGQLAVSKGQFVREFHRAGLRVPIIHKEWFEALSADDLPPEIAFAFIDGDFYRSTISALTLIWPRMTRGSRLLIDDYGREALPGVERAAHDFFRGTVPLLTVTHDIALLKK